MKWLLCLYPPAWKRRYRKEVREHLQHEPVRFRTALDLLAGAVDAWTNPGFTPETEESGDEQTMIKASRCRSADIPMKDAATSAVWMIGLTLVLTITATVLDKTLGPNIFVEALLYSAFFIAFTLSGLWTFFKPYSRAAKTVLILLGTVGWYAFFLIVTWISELT